MTPKPESKEMPSEEQIERFAHIVDNARHAWHSAVFHELGALAAKDDLFVTTVRAEAAALMISPYKHAEPYLPLDHAGI